MNVGIKLVEKFVLFFYFSADHRKIENLKEMRNVHPVV